MVERMCLPFLVYALFSVVQGEASLELRVNKFMLVQKSDVNVTFIVMFPKDAAFMF